MYHLKLCKALSYSGVVSATKQQPDVFVEDESTARAAVATGFFALVEGDEITPPPKAPTGTITKFDTMNATQLKKYAKENDIDLGGATKKEDILPIIEAALKAADEEDDDPANQFVGNDPDDDKALEDMSDDELKVTAEKNSIDIIGLTNREEIIAAIKKAEPTDETGGGNNTGSSE